MYMNILFPKSQTFKTAFEGIFQSCSVHYGTIFIFKKTQQYAFLLWFIWAIMVMIISEKITCGLYIFSTMIDPF